MRRGVILVLLGLVGALSVGAASADTSVSRILDRTYTCATGYLGGIYQAQLEVYGRVHDPAAGDRLAYGEVTTTPSWRLAGLGTSWVEINPTHCNPLEAPGTLATRGLRGGQVGGLGRVVRCETPARLIVRIRGAFMRATALRPYHVVDLTFLRAQAPARVTTVGLSTIKGRPIATLRIENGKAFLFTSANCEED